MNAYAIKCNLHSPNIHFFDYLMFHGQAVDEAPYVRDVNPYFGDVTKQPLYLIRNGKCIPHVFEVSLRLIVSETVKDRLQELPHLAFMEVRFHKLINIPTYQAGVGASRQNTDLQALTKLGGIEEVFRAHPDDPALHDGIGRFYELIVSRLSDVAPKYAIAHSIVCNIATASIRNVEMRLSSELLRDYPVVWNAYYVFSETAFARISSFVNREYFSVAQIRIE